MAAPNQQLGSPLFRLPWELRERIYEFYLAFTRDDFTDSMRPMHMYLDAEKPPHSTPLPPLMESCKLSCTELAPLVHSTAALRVYRPGARNERRIGFAVHGTLRFERLRRLVLVVDLDYAYWNAWLDFFGAIMARAGALEHLVVDWAPRRATSGAAAAWEARRDEKKERVFLDLLLGSGTLQTLRFFGQVPDRWAEARMQHTGLTIRQSAERWWTEPGFGGVI
ncbi:hypothetical protein SUNI508_14021 [Seiridium unicorne]|uniref:Uncharacterized protein n=1 Tax=Seiridium unicorne TaxID=138068 RepID=A0ABR2V9K4_9PEZI